VRLYSELAKKAFQRQVAYRGATLAGLVTNLFFGVLRVQIMAAVFGGRAEVADWSMQDVATYTGLTQALIAFVALWGWYDMVRSIKGGEVALDFTRPYDYQGYWLAQDAGRALYQLAARGLAMMGLFWLLYRISWPQGLDAWLLTLLSLAGAWLVSFGWRFLVSTTAFWATDAAGIARLGFFAMLFPSGFLVPLAFMPSWLAALCSATPFPSMINTPVTIYLGQVSNTEALQLLAVQLFWAVLLLALGRLATEAGRRKLVVQGG
jgi:ABC-2 type transport system permease protein